MSQNALPNKGGRLVVIEGADGIGKSTQIELLCSRLRSIGETVVKYDFPHKNGNPVGDLIGNFLKGQFGQVTPEFLALAFSLDRLSSHDSLIADLSEGKIVVCDRYVSSNVAFQGAKLTDHERRMELEKLLEWLEYSLFQLPRPNMEIFMISDDQFFIDGDHLERNLDTGREYIGLSADIHENARHLQVSVNNFYVNKNEDDKLRKVPIQSESRYRFSSLEVHEKIFETIFPLLDR